ncbi:MAG: aldo/keto reductase [Vicinamibacterales bacterium]
MRCTRRRFLQRAAAVAALPAARGDAAWLQAPSPRMHTRPIPATGEALPIVGVGTWLNFDVAPGSDDYRRLPGVLDALFAAGGTVIDSSPMYRRAERTTGELLAARSPRPPAFLATKVWTRGRAAGIAQMDESFRLLQTARIDLMQVHNLLDWRTHLATLRAWKAEGRIRYLGITHYTSSAYDQVEAVLAAEPLDFLQINYALDDRGAERRLLPLARDRGVAVLVNMPFGGGGLLGRLRDRPLPGWAAEAGAVSWAQLALRFVLGHPAVTCVIPGTGNPRYMAENAAAGAARPLTDAERRDLVTAAG